MLLDLFNRTHVDQRSGGDVRFQTVPDTHMGDRGRHFFGELVIDAFLHVDPVCADAGLAVVAELGDHGALDGGIHVSVVENNERRVAAQFQRQLHDLLGALRHQNAANFGRAGKGELADFRIVAEFLADWS